MDEAAVQASKSDAAQLCNILRAWRHRSIHGYRQRKLADFLAFYDMTELLRHIIITEKDVCA